MFLSVLTCNLLVKKNQEKQIPNSAQRTSEGVFQLLFAAKKISLDDEQKKLKIAQRKKAQVKGLSSFCPRCKEAMSSKLQGCPNQLLCTLKELNLSWILCPNQTHVLHQNSVQDSMQTSSIIPPITHYAKDQLKDT